MTAFERWCFRPAKWWQFWLPQSGAVGGTIIGIMSFPVVVLITVWLVAP